MASRLTTTTTAPGPLRLSIQFVISGSITLARLASVSASGACAAGGSAAARNARRPNANAKAERKKRVAWVGRTKNSFCRIELDWHNRGGCRDGPQRDRINGAVHLTTRIRMTHERGKIVDCNQRIPYVLRRKDIAMWYDIIAAAALAGWLYLIVARGAFWLASVRDDASASLQAPWPTVVA